MKNLSPIAIAFALFWSATAHAAHINIISAFGDAEAQASGGTENRLLSTNLNGFSGNVSSSGLGSFASGSVTWGAALSGDALSATAKGSCAAQHGQGWGNMAFDFQTDVPYNFYLSVIGHADGPYGGSRVVLVGPGGTRADTALTSSNGSGAFEYSGALPASGGSYYTIHSLCTAVTSVDPSASEGNYDVILSLSPAVGPNVPPISPRIIYGTNSSLSVVWPRAATDLILESTADLDAATWTPRTNDITTNGAYFSVTLDTTLPSQFFRLKAGQSDP